MTVFRKKRVFALLLLFFIVILFYSNPYVARILYPIEYEQEIRKNASNYNIDPFLLAAVIRVESNFKAGKQSHKGAFGLMQLMPDTAEWIVETAKFSPDWLYKLNQPEVSMEMGSWYIGWLHKQFKGNSYAALAGYNAGQGNVNKWIQSGEWDGSLENVDLIPFGETRHYVQRVLYYYKKYKTIYAEELAAG